MSAGGGTFGHFDFRDFYINEGAIFDLIYPVPYAVGLNRSYPKEFVARIFFAAASYMLHNKSIDYTRKRYDSDFDVEEKPQIRTAIEELLWKCKSFASHFLESERDQRIGTNHAGLVIFDIYSFRAFDSIQAAAMLANHGFFGETLSVLRHLVEQISWLSTIVRISDDVEIGNTRAEGSVTKAKEIFPHIGELYGVLSEASHFRFGHHARHFGFEEGRASSIRRSSKFAACGFIATVVCLIYLINLTIAVTNVQYPNHKVDSGIASLSKAILDYFQQSSDLFIKRILRASVDVDPEFRPWAHPILKLEDSSTHP